MTTTNETFPIMPFDGNQSSWKSWSLKFKCRAQLKQYGHILVKGYTLPDSKDTNYDKTIKTHHQAFCELLCCMRQNKDTLLVGNSVSSQAPDGDLSCAWNALMEKYQPTDSVTKFELLQMFQSLKLRSGWQADRWVEELEQIRNQLQ